MNTISYDILSGNVHKLIDYTLKNFFENGSRMVLIKRHKIDLFPRNIGNLLDIYNDQIKKLSKGRFNSTCYYNQDFWLVYRDDKGAIIDRCDKSIIKCFALKDEDKIESCIKHAHSLTEKH